MSATELPLEPRAETPPPLSPADLALIFTAAAACLHRNAPETLRLYQLDLADLLPKVDRFHPRLAALPEAVGAFVDLGDLRRPRAMATGLFERAWFDMQANVAVILAARAGAAMDAVARAEAQEGRAA
ncbi:MAG: hypothetical protein VYD87_17175 [Pseudomonadota bacterium]|nr:hypothetical protein [Pseudomonadota bacterium]MEE3101948.1 hypothetical protein [Pseudomonadota bacterium]